MRGSFCGRKEGFLEIRIAIVRYFAGVSKGKMSGCRAGSGTSPRRARRIRRWGKPLPLRAVRGLNRLSSSNALLSGKNVSIWLRAAGRQAEGGNFWPGNVPQRAIAAGQCDFASGQRRIVSGQRSIATGQNRNVTGQRRIATGQNRFATGQNHIVTGQNRFGTGQNRIATGQNRVATGQWRIASGQWRVAGPFSAAQAPPERREPVTSPPTAVASWTGPGRTRSRKSRARRRDARPRSSRPRLPVVRGNETARRKRVPPGLARAPFAPNFAFTSCAFFPASNQAASSTSGIISA
jgi:hypothetical protein